MRQSQPLVPMSLAVVGAPYVPERRFEILICEPGEPVELRLEPRNKHDHLAVAVYSMRGVQLGYLTAERAPRIGSILREGREIKAVFQRVSPFGAWIRAGFDGEEPLLPAVPDMSEGDREFVFEPDPIWPDD